MSNDYGDAMEEVILVKKAQQGDRRAFCDLYSLYKEPFYRYALYRLGHPEDAEDAVSECILQLWHRLPTLREPAAFRTFAYRVLSACCARLIRAQIDRRGQDNADDAAFAGRAEMTTTDHTDTHLILEESLRSLTEQERQIVLLSAVSGLNSKEIADITGLSAGGVRSSLSRSLKKLRQQLTS